MGPVSKKGTRKSKWDPVSRNGTRKSAIGTRNCLQQSIGPGALSPAIECVASNLGNYSWAFETRQFSAISIPISAITNDSWQFGQWDPPNKIRLAVRSLKLEGNCL